MKTHEVIKPQPRTFSSHSLRLNEKHNNYVKPIVTVSTKDVTVAKDGDKECTMLPIDGDGDSAAQPYAENSTMSTKWWESLLNESSDKIGSCTLLQEKEYSNLEFANVEKFLNQDSDINLFVFCLFFVGLDRLPCWFVMARALAEVVVLYLIAYHSLAFVTIGGKSGCVLVFGSGSLK
ncbi:hypothetical protein TSUD_213230 [Trifolium subterraneum]|uniref:Uncharacterized protein n=1 Tax=Trifolium subterraneum TaxID=3900 RepID=A0A2Z6N249_TRISU|nr:hypothetical protein TSUD_213230 [Trifolium subterraneum]